MLKNNFEEGLDGSINGNNGYEYRSTPANGDKFLDMIDGFCKELNDKEYKVDNSCGYHLHIETLPNLELIQKLYVFYSKYEPFFFKMLPKSRQFNEYCKKFSRLDRYDWDEVLKVKNLNEFKKLFYNRLWFFPTGGSRSYGKRMAWINFHSIFYRGTLEIRAHSGTTNAEKIKNWALIHLRIREYLEKNSLGKISKIKPTKENFLKIFNPQLKNYISQRWSCFPEKREIEFMQEFNRKNKEGDLED